MSTILKEIRKKHGLTQTEFASKLGVSRSAIAQIELGKNNISMPLAKKVSMLFGVTIDGLISNNHMEVAHDLIEQDENPNAIWDTMYGEITLILLNIDKIEITIITIKEFAKDKNLNEQSVLDEIKFTTESLNYYQLINQFKKLNSSNQLNQHFIDKVKRCVDLCLKIALDGLYKLVSSYYGSLKLYYDNEINKQEK